MNKQDIVETEGSAATQNGNVLQKNNKLTQDWLKTVENRDKLRLLEMTANEEESKS